MNVEKMIDYRLHGNNGNFGQSIDDIFSKVNIDDTLVLFDVDYYIGQTMECAEFPTFPKYPNYALKTLQSYADKKNIFNYCYTRGEAIDIYGMGGDLLGDKKYILSCLYDNNMDLFIQSSYYKGIKDDIIAIGGSNNHISGEYDYVMIISKGVAFIKFTDGCPNKCGFCCCRHRPWMVRKTDFSDEEYIKLKTVSKVVILDENIGLKLFRFHDVINRILQLKNVKNVEITNGLDYRFVLANERNSTSYVKLKESGKLTAMFAYDGSINALAEKCYDGRYYVCIYSLYGNMKYKNKFEMVRDLYYNIALKSRDDSHTDPQLRYPALNNKEVTTWLQQFSQGNIISRYKFAKKLAYHCTGDEIFNEKSVEVVSSNFVSDYFSTEFEAGRENKTHNVEYMLSMGVHWTLCASFLLNHGRMISRQVCEYLEIEDARLLDTALFIENAKVRTPTIYDSFGTYMLKEMDEVGKSINRLRGGILDG